MMQETNLPPTPDIEAPPEAPEPEETIDVIEEPVQTRHSVLLWSVLVTVAFVCGLGAGYLIWERPLTARAVAAEQQLAAVKQTSTADSAQNQVAVPDKVQRYDVPTDGDPSIGSDKAPITIVEFSDYECPYCQRWHQEVYPQLEKKYGDKIRLVYRDFPLYGVHPDAESAAEAANCAGEQKKYWDYHNLLLGGQKQFSKDLYIEYANKLSLNTDQFTKCIDEHRYLSEVKADYEFASKLGVRSTPTFFINGLAVVGAQPIEVFQQVIDLELSGKIPK